LDPEGIDVCSHPRGQSVPSCTAKDGIYWVSFHTGTCDSTYSNVYFVRVNASGQVLDANGVPICNAEGDQRETKFASGDDCLMVLWENNRDYDSTSYDVYGSRVSSDGMVLDPASLNITSQDLSERGPHLCWTGETFLSVWEAGSYTVPWEITGVRIDTLGRIKDWPPLVFSTACHAQMNANSSWSGSSYMTIWEEDGDLKGIRIDQYGNILDSAGIDICADSQQQGEPDIVWGGESFLAVWEELQDSSFDILGTRIDSTGVVLNTTALPLSVEPATDQRYPSVASDGSNYLVVWQNMLEPTGSYHNIKGIRISPSGEPVDPQAFSISSGDKGSCPDVAFGDSKYLVVWEDVYFFDIYGALVDVIGGTKSQFGIRVASGIQENPVVASDGSAFLVVWEDYGMHWPNADILATRVSSAGVVLDPGYLALSTNADPDLVPSVSFDGENYVVAWKRSENGSAGLYESRVTPEGVVLDPDGVFVSDLSTYSGTSISSGPISNGKNLTTGQSLMLFSKYQSLPYNSHRVLGSFFWGDPEPNQPPEPFSLILPVDGDTVTKPVFLDWEDAYDPNPFDQVSYTVYVSASVNFDPESTLVIDSLIESACQVVPQKDSLVYWWKVKAQDLWGETRWSDQTWSFDLENYGDANGDGKVDPGDVVFLLNYLFRDGPPPQPLAAGDVNGDCEVDAADVVYLISYLFRGGSKPQPGCV
jgi:hypothetical protein